MSLNLYYCYWKTICSDLPDQPSKYWISASKPRRPDESWVVVTTIAIPINSCSS